MTCQASYKFINFILVVETSHKIVAALSYQLLLFHFVTQEVTGCLTHYVVTG